MAVIFVASTDLGSAEHTARLLEPFLRWLYPNISPEAIAQSHFVVRKLAHLTAYAILATLIWRALTDSRARTTFTLLLCIGYAAIDEFHQSFVASRGASSRDVAIDVCGALLAVIALRFFQNRGPERI